MENTKIKELYEKYLKPTKYGLIEKLTESIDDTIPHKARLLSSMVEVSKLATHLRIVGKKELDDSIIPSGLYALMFVRSGGGKDRSTRKTSQLLGDSYKYIEKQIRKEEEKRAETYAILREGADAVEKDKFLWEKYKKRIPSLVNRLATMEGILKSANLFSSWSHGGLYMTEGEFSSALKGGKLDDALPLLAEGYDTGQFNNKMVSGEQSSIPTTYDMTTTMFLYTDPTRIFKDSSLKEKFLEEMTSRGARRFMTLYINDYPLTKDIVSEEEEREKFFKSVKSEKEAQQVFKDFNNEISAGRYTQTVIIPNEIWFIHEKIAKTYWKMRSEMINDRTSPLLRLAYSDVQWRGMKLAIAISGLRDHSEMTIEDYRMGVYYSSQMFETIEEFEKDMNIEEPQLLAKFIENHTSIGENIEIKPSELMSIGVITSKTSRTRIKDILNITKGLLPRHNITIDDRSIITAEQFAEDGEIGVSLLLFKNDNKTKEYRVQNSRSGYQYKTLKNFRTLENVVSKDFAYVPFKLKDGVLLKENVISGTKFLAFDVDKNDSYSIHDMHDMLGDVNHIIATTSNKENIYRYRILIELDSVIELDRSVWIKTMASLADYLGIATDIDMLHKTQAMYGYSGSLVLSEYEAEPLSVDVIMKISESKKEDIERKAKEAEGKRKTSKAVIKSNYMTESQRYIAQLATGFPRRPTLYKAYKYFADYIDDMDFIADKIIDYIINKAEADGMEPLSDKDIESLKTQVRRNG